MPLAGVRKEDGWINLIDAARENWSFWKWKNAIRARVATNDSPSHRDQGYLACKAATMFHIDIGPSITEIDNA
jgi:hypothetical protein